MHAALQAARPAGRGAGAGHHVGDSRYRPRPDEWPYIGAKAGNLPGELTFSWYAVDRTGQPWVVSLQTNWPRFRSPTAGGWLMSIIKQMFALIPSVDGLTSAASTAASRPARAVQHGAADRCNVDAPERFRRRVEDNRMAARITAGWVTATSRGAVGRQRIQPAPHPGNQIDDRFAAVRRRCGVGQPDREVGGLARRRAHRRASARSRDRPAAVGVGASGRAVRRSGGSVSPDRRQRASIGPRSTGGVYLSVPERR